jgi:putative permease
MLFGDILAPVLASIVIAYLLEGPIGIMEKRRVPRPLALTIVFFSFMLFLLFVLLWLLPLLVNQVGELFQQLPSMISLGHRELQRLPERYPDFVTRDQVESLIAILRNEVTSIQRIISVSMASVQGLIKVLIFIILMPLVIFFLLKDKDRILDWVIGFLPAERSLAMQVWKEVDRQIGNYVRGKVWEILIVWAASFITFSIMGLPFSMLISLVVGLSVLIPYIGAILAALPLYILAYFQWGWESQFFYVVVAYLIIQTIDGNLLSPLIFSEVVNLHPVAIVTAILFFGGIWGFWGIFFAIPLATLVQAILNAWPREHSDQEI